MNIRYAQRRGKHGNGVRRGTGRLLVMSASCAMVFLCAGAAGAAEQGAVAGKAPPVANPRSLTTNQSLAEREKDVTELIRKSYRSGDARSAMKQFGRERLVNIDPRKLALGALTRNLSILRGNIQRDVAKAALQEAQALFDPVLNFALNYSRNATYNRTENLIAYKRATQHITSLSDPRLVAGLRGGPANGGCNAPNLVPATVVPSGIPFVNNTAGSQDLLFLNGGIICYLGFDKPRPAGLYPTTEDASTAPIQGADERFKFDFDVNQLMPWGVNISMNYEVNYHHAAFVNNPGPPRDLNLTTTGDYNRPFTSAVGLTLTLPAPGSKNFGPDSAAADVSNRLAGLNDQKAVWQVNAIINATLLQVDLAYWNLVKAANDLYAAIQNRQSVEKLLNKTKKLYNLRLLTDYDKVQVEAEYQRVKGQVEQAWNQYVSASNALHPLLDTDGTVIYLPTGYTAMLLNPLQVDPASKKVTDISANPDLKAQDYDVKSAKVVRRQAELQLRPDVTMSANVRASQLGVVFGYHDYLQSTAHLFDPDQITQNYAVTLARPWGNRAAKAAYDQANLGTDIQHLNRRSLQNSVERELSDATVGLVSAEERSKITLRNRNLAQLAYDKAVALQRSRGVTEYEIIVKSNELLTANRNWVAAIIGVRQAEARLLAAQGRLAAKYGELTSQTKFDRARVAALARNDLIPHFAGEASDAQ